MRARDDSRSTDAESGRVRPRPPTAGGEGRLQGLSALQGAAGNEAVVQMLRRDGHPWAREQHQHGAGCGHQEDGGQPAGPAVQRSAVHNVLSTGGRPLDDTARADMEGRLGADFADVRIHTDAAAKASAAEIGARAYTSGNHIVIGDGGADEHTLAHELTHVIQQRQGPVAGTDNGAGLSVSDPSDRFEREAEANATRAMSVPGPSAGAGGRLSSGGPDVARAADHRAPTGDPAVQRATEVQRLETKELVIQGVGGEGPTTIRSASDLLIWLQGHPVRPAPRNYAEPAVLQKILARLELRTAPVGHVEVWNVLREVIAPADSSSESESESDEEGGFFRQTAASRDSDEESDSASSVSSSDSESEDDWEEGEWKRGDIGLAEPQEFRRRMPEEVLAERKRILDESLSGYRLVGFHGTNVESVGSLVTHGPDPALVGVANGVGKGPGFYVAPVVGPVGVTPPGTSAAKNDAKLWGKFLLAVYVKADVHVERHFDASDAGFEFESDDASTSGPVMTYYGSDELVIPSALFGNIKLVRNVDDVAMTSDPAYEVEAYEDGVSQYSKAPKKGKPKR
ncbi:DUF4157 domain-containing protein [Streptomyces sp. NPDC057474]|uniref:DUF4157 domain-containing protein n=1 Tax=Streptomyces sp. NPDC057474 TaxID=3346144 RepID=UPI0036914822